MFSEYKYLIVICFSHLGFWSKNFFLIAPFPDHCLLVSVKLPRLKKRMLGLIEKFFSIRVFGIAKVCDGAYHRPSVYTIFFSLFR